MSRPETQPAQSGLNTAVTSYTEHGLKVTLIDAGEIHHITLSVPPERLLSVVEHAPLPMGRNWP